MYPHERSLVENMQGRPFALLGVNSDRDLESIRKTIREENLTWRSFWNGPEGTRGPISSLWNVRGWPTIYIIDHTGKIHAKNKRGKELDKVLEELVAKAEAESKAGTN